jgi:hypothetical protein
MKRSVVFILALVLVLLSGCSGQGVNQPQETSTGTLQTDPTVSGFTGPYKDQFQEIADKYQSNTLVMSIISDEKVTQEELDEVYGKYDTCLKSSGITSSYLTPGDYAGTVMTVAPSLNDKQQVDVTKKCEKEYGFTDLVSLEDDVSSNPNKEDFYKIMAECLVRHGMAPDGYTKDDFVHDIQNQTGVVKEYMGVIGDYSTTPSKEKSASYMACQNNPLE